ncbi:MAG: NrdH-redoxin [Elusimicrobia bacterium]|nr:NrdH-redoxin [Candidatus Liberimonas magnetica]
MSRVIKVYSTSTCPYCATVKEFLKKNNVLFEDINIGNDAQKAREMMDKSGQLGVPVIDIDGKIIIGFDKEEIKKELNIK